MIGSGPLAATATAAAPASSLDAVAGLLSGRRIVVLSGAGCSTESGIPDYRGPGTARRRPPVQYQEFVRDAAARRRYWGRSSVGWERFAASRPNAAHHALAQLEAGGIVMGIITQNVDGLHHAAGSSNVVELHGSLAAVRCLDCGGTISRFAWQQRLLADNMAWTRRVDAGRVSSAPDGDADLEMDAFADFQVPECTACGGIMKPDVVFFGENVPKATVEEAWRVFASGDVLLVAGSSLTVYSGRRFIYRAQQDGVPVVVVNLGPTRADDVAAAKVDGRLGAVLPELSRRLLS